MTFVKKCVHYGFCCALWLRFAWPEALPIGRMAKKLFLVWVMNRV